MKTVSEIAAEIGVSPQAIRKKIKKLDLEISLQTDGKTFAIDNSIESALKQAFQNVNANQFANGLQTNENGLQTVFDNIIGILKVQLEEKDRQIAEKDKQIADLTETIKTQAQSINAANHNELAETLQQRFLSDGQEEAKRKRGIFCILSRKREN